jgi:serine/threonine protein kinase
LPELEALMPETWPLRPEEPRSIGAYSVVGRLGEGGQGVVYLGQTGSGERVAIKLLQTHLGEDQAARTRFVRELGVAKRVARFCTAQVLDADIAGDRPYIVSEYVEGPSLSQMVAGSGPLSGAALERLAIGTATALAAIHQAGIVHRDFKPGNVLLGPDGPRVIDFGVAKAFDPGSTASSAVLGTPSYMAPEQLGADRVGPPADVFAWASTMVYARTGSPPFGADTIPAVIGRILHAEPWLGDLTEPLRGFVIAALAKDPTRRPTAPELLMRLIGHQAPPPQMLAEGQTLAAVGIGEETRVDAPVAISPAPPPPQPPVRPGRRSRRMLPVAIGATALLVTAGVAVWALNYDFGPPGPTPTSSSTAGRTSTPATGQTSGSAPRQARLVATPTGGVSLGAQGTTADVTLTTEGGDVAWEAEPLYDRVALSRSNGVLRVGESVKVRITAPGSPREGGRDVVTFRAQGTPDQSLAVNWDAAPQ